MKKILAIVMALLLCTAVFAACGGKGGENTAPTLEGVKDTASVEAGSEFDALAGVTAADAEDGDLTSAIVISSTPELTFTNGKTTPSTPGNYELTYAVTDSGALTTEAYCTLTVTRQTQQETEYLNFDFDNDLQPESHGWVGSIGGSAQGTAALQEGAYVFDVTNPGGGDGDVKLAKAGFALKAADYKIKVWAKSTAETYAHILARDENAEGWSTFGGEYNVRIGTKISALEMNFTSAGEGSAELLIHMGKITPNPNNPDDTTPEAFKVTIDKIEIYEITGTESYTELYGNDFAEGVADVTVSAGDGAAASVAEADGAAQVNITRYPNGGGVWSIKTDVLLGGVTIENGVKYQYSMKVTAQNAQAGELLVESKAQADKNRANFASISLEAGETKTITGTFTSGVSVSDPVFRFQIGNASAGVTSNTLTIDDVSFGKLTGDKQTVKTTDRFMAYGRGSENETNPDYLWDTFNGTDEDNELGVGTIWTEGGSLFYRIDQGGTTDWHNKLFFGYTVNPMVLEADSYYTIRLTIKADKPVSGTLVLNTLGSWEPRLTQALDITTEEQTFEFKTTDTFVLDMEFELLFQFGSAALAEMGEVTLEISELVILQSKVA